VGGCREAQKVTIQLKLPRTHGPKKDLQPFSQHQQLQSQARSISNLNFVIKLHQKLQIQEFNNLFSQRLHKLDQNVAYGHTTEFFLASGPTKHRQSDNE